MIRLTVERAAGQHEPRVIASIVSKMVPGGSCLCRLPFALICGVVGREFCMQNSRPSGVEFFVRSGARILRGFTGKAAPGWVL